MFFTDEEGEYLVKLARKSVETFFSGEKPVLSPPTEKLMQKFGVFTTIKKGNTLRGCIGYPYPFKPLCEAVVETARLAAFEDPRFPPLSEHELPEITFEVSILTPPERLDDPGKIEIGKHGLIVKKGPFSGLLLPQVPVEEGWDTDEFLAYCSMKAGLPPDGWKDAELYVFTAEVFAEESPNGKVKRVFLTPVQKP